MSGATALPRATRHALRVLLLVYVLNFLDRQVVNILAEPIARDLGLSDTQIGLLTGIAFAALYTVLGVPIARFADRPGTNRVRLIAVALAAWSGMTALCGLAQNFVQLLLARVGVGVGEAGCTPAAHSLIADLVEPARRASAMAFYSLGIPIGSLLGLLIGGQLADAWGWRAAFLVVGLPGIALAALLGLLIRDPRTAAVAARTSASVKHASEPLRDALAAILSSRALVLVVAAGTAAAFLSYGKATWTVIFFQRSHGLSAGETGFWLGMGVGIASVAGTWLGGWIADRWGRDERRHVLTAPALGMLVAVPLAWAAYVQHDWRLTLTVLLLPTLLNALYYGPVYSSVQGLVRPRHRALASALLLFCQNLIGLGLGPLFLGVLSDTLKPVAGADSVRWALFAAALLGILPALLFWRASLLLDAELDRRR